MKLQARSLALPRHDITESLSVILLVGGVLQNRIDVISTRKQVFCREDRDWLSRDRVVWSLDGVVWCGQIRTRGEDNSDWTELNLTNKLHES
jgi:hypothetical protein